MTQRKLNNFSLAAGYIQKMRGNGECVTGYTAGGQRVVAPFVKQSAKPSQVVGANIAHPKDDSMPDG